MKKCIGLLLLSIMPTLATQAQDLEPSVEPSAKVMEMHQAITDKKEAIKRAQLLEIEKSEPTITVETVSEKSEAVDTNDSEGLFNKAFDVIRNLFR